MRVISDFPDSISRGAHESEYLHEDLILAVNVRFGVGGSSRCVPGIHSCGNPAAADDIFSKGK